MKLLKKKILQLTKLYAAAVQGVNTPKAEESARQYRASLNMSATNVDERFDEALLKGLYESLYESVIDEEASIKVSGAEISERLVQGFKNEMLVE